jgi:hypothetical protein
VFVCVCVCACVRERERERERANWGSGTLKFQRRPESRRRRIGRKSGIQEVCRRSESD